MAVFRPSDRSPAFVPSAINLRPAKTQLLLDSVILNEEPSILPIGESKTMPAGSPSLEVDMKKIKLPMLDVVKECVKVPATINGKRSLFFYG